MAVSKKNTGKVTEILKDLVKKNKLAEANSVFKNIGGLEASDPGLVKSYADILMKAGKLKEAEQLLEIRLRSDPDCFALLIKLGNLDEKRGQNLNAFDLYQRAEFLAKTVNEKRKVLAAKTRVKENMQGKTYFGTDAFSVKLYGNSRPLELEYSLGKMAIRKKLLDTILANLDPKAKTVLEIECDAGIITKNLADHGFKVEGTSARMEDIVLAMGFEYTEIIRKAGLPSPSYHQYNLTLDSVSQIEKKDVIMVLPFDPDWYNNRGAEESAELLLKLANLARKQLYFFFPFTGEEGSKENPAVSVIETLKHKEGLPSEPILCYQEKAGGSLYRVDRRQASDPNKSKVLPIGPDVLFTKSAIFEVPVEKCRSLNGFCYSSNGWDPFVATLKEKFKNPDLEYENSILKRFFDSFQPGNRQEQLFGAGVEAMPPLNQGWTLFPWMETKNRRKNPVESPVTRNGGNHHYGPNTERFGKIEFNKLLSTFNLIARHGYIPEIFPDGYMLGYFLKNGDDYVLHVNEGQHRMAAIGVIGIEVVKAKLSPEFMPVVDLKNIAQWPQVKSGLYTKELAEKVFRYYFEEDGRRKARTLGLL